MSHRIHQLEDALAVSHGNQSNEAHPLLCDELLEIKFWPERGNGARQSETQKDDVETSLDAFGTLTLGGQGEAKYFGGSAGSEVRGKSTHSLGWDDSERDDDSSFLPESVRESVHELIWSQLPEQMRAWSLTEAYFEHAQWFLSAISRDEIVNEIMVPIYKSLKEKGRPKYSSQDTSETNPHRLGILYFVFCLGALMDLTLPPANPEAEKYYRLGRAAMSLRSLVDAPLIETVQAIAMMGAYHHMSGRKASLDSAWSLTAFSVKLAQSVSHRDCARWGLDAKTVQKRRHTFWSIMAADGFLSLHMGRPLACPLDTVDCEFPTEDDLEPAEDGTTQMGYQRWRFHIMKNWLLPVCEQMTLAKGPDYKKLLALDANILQHQAPKNFKFLIDPEEQERPSSIARAYLLSQFRLNTMMFIHRSFFAQAILDHPTNPFRSPYAPSYLTAYRCASAQLAASIHFYNRLPELFIRLSSFWTHAFTAALIAGFVVSRTPHSGIATTAFIELNRAMDFFESAATKNPRAFRALVRLLWLTILYVFTPNFCR
ncbi:hypothetical protein GLOTRDRAFT_33402 [Gloeophyllum trabeum ATCC 11539]|uniref:Xylanolytic transcriptional activator regulatory domain-containing protein n=1 Tax=Gloeophyllum trabeum (strain ATCC 11539 / FP-39264 / Madison 617) TaxID=670483 RepID=S7RZI3_GLOTA|nr:uncharacterized protein GLOTRDRAFT_33402 [Gloeophyllum trabeum ATCC 11539]EPQ58859.1 hypothetical protein GLOTRDRAFT_33402 [Gloeophyllum trabeum ATCC 11539]